MPLRIHISTAIAAATIHGPDILEQIVRADCADDAEDRIAHLQEALSQAAEIVSDLTKAIEAEKKLTNRFQEMTI